MRIAVDVMGGDRGAAILVEGAALASQKWDLTVILIGDQDAIHAALPPSANLSRIEIRHASQIIEMEDSPITAIRKKPDASMVIASDLVKSGEADGMVSAGNTGAAMALATMNLGRVEGIERPAIATVLPTEKGGVVLLDAGANVDCKPHHLLQFAMMGSIYAKEALGRDDPRVALLSIGEEETKGNDLTKASHRLLQESSLHFIGNVEGRDLLSDKADVIVCDGFVGNVVLKTIESTASLFAATLKSLLKQGVLSRMGYLLSRRTLRSLRQRMDYASVGGAPLLGINGIFIISHGSSNATAMLNAVGVAKRLAEAGLVKEIREALGNGAAA